MHMGKIQDTAMLIFEKDTSSLLDQQDALMRTVLMSRRR